MERFTIETGHMDKLEREMIEYVLDNTNILVDIDEALYESECLDDVLSPIFMDLEEAFDEVRSGVEEEVECEETEDASEWVSNYYELARCFSIHTTREVEEDDRPDLNACAIRLLAAFMEEKHGGIHRLHEVAGWEDEK